MSMSNLFFIPLAIFILSISVFAFLVLRKIPYVRTLDVEKLLRVKSRELKSKLMAERLLRRGKHVLERLKETAAPWTTAISAVLRRALRNILALEERYQQLQKSTPSATLDEEEKKRLWDEGRVFMKEGRFGEAEKRFLELLSHDQKNFRVYEDLGALYILIQQFDQAEETLTFVKKARPGDASVLVHLGELELARGNVASAHGYFSQAVEIRPNNPKYLDFFIEAGLRAGKFAAVREGLERLKSVNPENQKLPVFAERLIELENRPEA